MEGRAPLFKAHCWRGPTEKQGLGRCKAPTWKDARRKKGAGVGVARRRNKGLRDARRQHGRTRAEKKAPGLAWPDEGTKACREGGANMEGRALRKRRQGWRGPTEEQGLGRCKAPTWKPARWKKGAGVGVAQRWNKGLRGARRQHGRPRAAFQGALLARSNGEARAWEVQGANMEARALGIGNRKRAAAAALFVLLTSVVLFRQKCSFQ